MADYQSSLPVRTELPGDIASKIVDATTPSQGLSVDASGKIHSKLSDGAGNEITSQVSGGTQRALDVGIVVAGAQIDPRDVRPLTAGDVVTAEQGTSPWVVSATDLDIRDLAFATDKVDVSGSEVSLDATTLAALESITVQNGAGAAAVNIQDGGNSLTVDATDLDIRDLNHAQDNVAIAQGGNTLGVQADGSITSRVVDAAGAAFSAINPLPVTLTQDNAGDEINAHSTQTLAVSATANFDYPASPAKTLILTQIEASASGKIKVVVAVETALGSGVYANKFVQFNSTANPNCAIQLKSPIKVEAGVNVRVSITNRDNQSQDVYATISGQEI